KTAPEITIGFEMAPNSKSPIFKGTTEIGATITIDVAGATYITTAADGTWSLDTTTAEETYGTLNLDYNGTNLVSATATDIAGNSSSQNYNYATQSEVSYFTGYELKAPVGFYGYDEYYGNEITAIGTSGEFIVTFAEMQSSILFPDCDISDIDYDSLVFVQKFNELAEPIGPIIQLDKADNTASQQYPKITEIGTNGEFIVTYTGLDIHEDGCSYDSSVFVQKFSAAGIPVGPLIHLDAGRNETSPQVTEIGTDGEFVVTFSSYGLVYVQKFNADGTVIPDSMVTMRVLSDDYANAVTPHDTVQIGTEGEFVVTYGGEDNIYVQKFDSDGVASGSLVQLEGVTLDDYTIPKITALGADGEFAVAYKTYGGVKVSKFNTDGTVHTEFSDSISSGYGYDPQIEALGTNGEFAVVYSGYDFEENFIHIQKFYPDGTKNGSVIEIISPDNSFDYTNWQITSLGTDGAFAVTFMKIHHSGEGDSSIYVQKFNPNATEAGSLIELKGPNNTDSNYEYPQIAAVGSDEEFVITFSGIDTQGDYSIFIQKFDTNGIPVENSIDLNTVELVGVTTDDTVLF
ncbi:MAG: large repetitive protein, partial [Campylobacterota bacterium]|nr:large repetitive protein [Campylobacterota bacterium]